MKIINIDKKNKEIKFMPQHIEDLWLIKNISENNDVISGNSYRRQKSENLKDSIRKPVFVSLLIEKIDFSSELNALRYTGIIKESKPMDLAPVGEHHTLEVQLNNTYTLKKEHLFNHEIDMLTKSTNISFLLLIVAIDDRCATIFELTNISLNEKAIINSKKSGKQYSSDYVENDFFEEIYEVIKKYDSNIILAGPGLTKTKLNSYLKQKIKNKVLEVNTQNVSVSSINEIFKKESVSKFLENNLIFKEQKLFDIFLENLGKDNNKSIYGLKDIEQAITSGAVDFILISEKLWKQKIDMIQNLILLSEKVKTNVHIVSEAHSLSKNINSFSGIVAVLRYSLK